ncbi:MAG: mannose-1-phosphate guanylyltransferase [Chloroflexi bacterium]|nr:MAG: mannose-1-phosphate guanylyltransferase [Chloroflexota bacterium]MBA4375226.1 mannose-1-phosphate guanylyltransferase [Anaerolinea sp.]
MVTDKHFYAVIMAGGGGTRLWPLSRKATPKQMLCLFGGKSLFQIALDRLDGIFDPNQIFIVTVADQVDTLSNLAPHIPIANFLIEPMPRGTAAVVAMAAACIKKKDPEGVIAILTADHFIKNVSVFQNILKASYDLAKTGVLVTMGIQPTFPATGYGYIENGELVGEFQNLKAYKVNAFIEKPAETRAAEFLRNGKHNWNSGMFIWKVEVVLNEIRRFMPTLYDIVNQLSPLLAVDHANQEFIDLWYSIKPQTIDYGIMEKSDRVVVIPASDLGWNDVGSWDSLFEVLSPDLNGNIVLSSKHIGIDTDDCLIYSTSPVRLVVTIGTQNMIVIDTPDAVLVCPRGESQKVKELVQYLKENHYTFYL